MNDGVLCDDRIVVVAHGAASSETPRYPSGLSRATLSIGPEAPDLIDAGGGDFIRYSGHKLGGVPYCIQEPELPGAAALLDDAYTHVLQLDFPGGQDELIAGDWPFADGLFNVFWRPPFDEPYYWAFQK